MSEISKCSSDGECGSRLCYCNNVVRNRTSWTSKNPGRRFETCAKYKVKILEEKLKMLEDNVEKKRLKIFKNVFVVIVVAMLLFVWDKKMAKGGENLYLL
ncbi:hypothetical protein DCAR_0519917 [Daucus carota subsp. sativus]|uniref:Transmembrane protein n=1 Tax=Daucus carota subsp. sativus TaxID=79200 RepID=A0AAF0X2E2_DAUCS|nr:hypothetical protein DCAR_0519917 [Daucus carota subsp. sativus]